MVHGSPPYGNENAPCCNLVRQFRQGMKEIGYVERDGFFNNKEWIEYIILAVVLWLLMMTAVHELDLRSVS